MIRNQAGAIVTVLALLYVAEPLVGFIPHTGRRAEIRPRRPGRRHHPHHGYPATAQLLGQGAAVLVLAGYTTAVLLTGAALLRHRDITA